MRLPLAAMAVCFSVTTACGSTVDAPDTLEDAGIEDAAVTTSLIVYDDTLENNFADWSWGTRNLAYTGTAHSGKSMSFEPDNWSGLYFHRDSTFDITTYGSLTFWINGGAGANQVISAAVFANGAVVASVPVSSIKADTWQEVIIPVSSFTGAKTIDGVALVDMSGGNQSTIYVDDFVFAPAVATAPTSAETVFADALAAGVADWSWGTHSLAATSPVHGGSKSISFEPDNWSALFFEFDNGFDLTSHTALSFWVYGASSMSFALVRAGAAVSNTAVTGVAGGWTKVAVDLTKLGVTGSVNGFWIADSSGVDQSTVFVDDVVFTITGSTTTGSSDTTVAVDRSSNRRAINPEIYGVNFGDDAQVKAMKYPARRWGGNNTTRYSWENDMANRGSDWFFMNTAESSATPAMLPDGSAADVFIDTTRSAGGQPLMTVPIIGWTPVDGTKRWSYSVSRYGAQQQTECTASAGASWCTADAGNGVLTNGDLITASPTDTSKAIDPTFVQRWIAHIQGRVGSAPSGVRYYALDNEPSLWNSTHRDVHPDGLTYDELWQRTLEYGKAVKAADPQAQTFGPAEWGWCGYLDSSGGCGASADRKAHDDLPMLAWYLKNVCAEQASSGVRVVDYLDIHYYPQETNVALTSDESAATQALRLRSMKSLYDPAYTDESWIATPIQLIPRMRDWIATYCPGTKIAITEYQFGNDAGISAALAQVEALAIFGREGVDFATRWTAPAADTLVEDAFKMFLNYDGAGSRVTGTSVDAVSTNVDSVGAYAVEGADGLVRLVLVNKDTDTRSVKITLSNAHTVALYGFDSGQRLGARGSVTGDGTSFTVSLAARSATLAVVTD